MTTLLFASRIAIGMVFLQMRLQMVRRQFWIDKIEAAWEKRPIVWLAGVRRVGKTSLCKSLEETIYYDCEQFSVRNQIENNYELFLKEHADRRVALDEIHKLKNPSEILKVAADHHPKIKIIATGSSTLEASKLFSDALTGRKIMIHLTPILLSELPLFGIQSISHRMLHGGLPDFFLSKQVPLEEYKDWFESFWAKDIHELFRLERKASFLKFTELLFAQSGGMFVAAQFATPCAISHTTVANYLEITRAAFSSIVVRPYSSHTITEIRSAPKVYSFDTGFACYSQGWTSLRQTDFGTLWEHLILNELVANFSPDKVHYWRDKSGHEVDFVFLKGRKEEPIAIECKWNSTHFDPRNIIAFRKRYPVGKNYMVASDLNSSYPRIFEDTKVFYVSPEKLINELMRSEEVDL